MSKKTLVIVESPGKVARLQAILGPDYEVVATLGHIADLPRRSLGIDLTTYEESYEATKPQVIGRLRHLAKRHERILLASDPDREGEAIAWHIAQALGGPTRRFSRVEFAAITPEAVRHAIHNGRALNLSLIEAQRCRRAIDRLVGYEVTPLIWQKEGSSRLSAGRVQTATLNLIVTRENEISDFTPAHHWTIHVHLSRTQLEGGGAFWAALDAHDLPSQDDLIPLLEEIRSIPNWWVGDFDVSPASAKAPPPFTTSGLQQAASTHLTWTPIRSMKVAQALYERGLITYLRTDSVSVDPDIQARTLDQIRRAYGREFCPEQPNIHQNRADSQEAHECIRPTYPQSTPDQADTQDADQQALYTLIWQRFMASQMTPGLSEVRTATIKCGPDHRSPAPYTFTARSSTPSFDGWRLIYDDHQAVADRSDADESPTLQRLPELAPGDRLTATGFQSTKHTTQPPARYSEARLIRAMEGAGIGRPSTYAATVETLKARQYVRTKEGKLMPTNAGQRVLDFCLTYFPRLFAIGYSAMLESALDKVADGQLQRTQLLTVFHRELQPQLRAAREAIASRPATIQFAAPRDPCPECGHALTLRRSRAHGDFVGCTHYPACRYTRPIATARAS